LKALQLADLLRNRDITFFDGGSVRAEAIKTYQHAIQTLLLHRKNLMDQGQSTNEITDMEALQFMQNNPELGNDELYIFDYKRKSVDGLLCAALTSLSKVFYMANMFEDSVDTTNLALQFKPYDLDAINQRANTYIILGKYKEAADDYVYMLEADRNRLFVDAFTGLAKVLTVKEGVVPGGWTALITVVNGHLALLEEKRQKNTSPEALSQYADKLHRMHMVLFQYYDTKVNDTDLAWTHLQKGKYYKMVTVQPFHFQADNQRIQSVIDVFQPVSEKK
jgi:tetratricopeptide (TPR) repeat protein